MEMPYHADFTQQHGFLHAGIVSTALDSACGYAAFSLMAADAAVLTIEFKINLLSPARGARFIFRAEVTKPGRTISVSDGRAYAVDENGRGKTHRHHDRNPDGRRRPRRDRRMIGHAALRSRQRITKALP